MFLSPQAQKIENFFREHVMETFSQYMSIPCVSPAFDSQWHDNGYIEAAITLYENFARRYAPKDAHVFVQRIDNKTPLLVIDVPARNYSEHDCVLMYGHLDKQPQMTGWQEGLEPFAATMIDNRMYGRGGADDGYAMFAALAALNTSEEQGSSRARTVVVIEASEESGSPDLPVHLEVLGENLNEPLGDVSLVVCLDSGCLTYDHLWITQSLRGLLQVNVTIKVLEEGAHSGGAGGIVPSSFHIQRALLDRICTSPSGEITLDELSMTISDHVRNSAHKAAGVLKTTEAHGLAFADNVQPLHEDIAEQIIANTYLPQLEVIGIDGMPAISDAGNVLLPFTTLALSFRLPPRVDPSVAAAAVTEQLVADTPYQANVSVVIDSMASGWEAPEMQPWFSEAVAKSSQKHFGDDVHFMGEGGTIPFMAMLGETYPEAQYMVTGVLGPASNAHGPNEFLDLPCAYKVTACVVDVLQAHGNSRLQE